MWFLFVRPRVSYSFLQIPPHDGHPCCSAMYFVVAYAYSGLTPVRARPWRANKKANHPKIVGLKYNLFANVRHHC